MIAIEIKEKVIMLIKELKQSSSGIPEKELISSGFLDSSDIISLVDRLEKAFGITVSGAKRWVNFFSLFSFQPAEILKLTLIIYLAGWLQQFGKNNAGDLYHVPDSIICYFRGSTL